MIQIILVMLHSNSLQDLIQDDIRSNFSDNLNEIIISQHFYSTENSLIVDSNQNLSQINIQLTET